MKKKKTLLALVITISILVAVIGSYFIICYSGCSYIDNYVERLEITPIGSDLSNFTYDIDKDCIVIKKTNDEPFKILQLTDTHIGGGVFTKNNDAKSIDSMYKTIKQANPDMIIITGDLIYAFTLQSVNADNISTAKAVAKFMERLQIPWTITFGNHDNERTSVANREELAEYFSCNELKYCMFYKNSKNYELSGYGNNIICVEHPGGTLNQILYLFDSHKTIGIGNYDKIHDDQAVWYEDSLKSISAKYGYSVTLPKSMAFFHIPMEEYKTAWELYESGSSEVQYLYGVCDDKILSYETTKKNTKGILFDTIVKLGSTQATFCGHDHKNNFAVVYKGIQLTFGASTVYNGIGGISKDDTYRGGTEILINNDGTFVCKNIFNRDF